MVAYLLWASHGLEENKFLTNLYNHLLCVGTKTWDGRTILGYEGC